MIIPQKLLGDCRQTLPTVAERSVHCCVTSIPYWGLRSYLPKGHPLKPLEIGCEPTFELYLDHISDAFKAVHRVLRDDGTLWVNVGDAYANDTKWGGASGSKNYTSAEGDYAGQRQKRNTGLKPKDLMMMPARVAMRLQADGYYLRSMIPWIKRNAMPESCEDRPATAVEYVFGFSKRGKYYYDRYAVMAVSSDNTHPRTGRDGSFKANKVTDETIRGQTPKSKASPNGSKNNDSFAAGCSQYVVGQRNRRNSDWFMESFQGLLTDEDGEPLALIVNPKGTTIQHFASYPPKLVEPFIKAGTSEGGCCAQCGAPLQRVIELGAPDLAHQLASGSDRNGEYHGNNTKDYQLHKAQPASTVKARILEGMREKKTTGWNRTCEHEGAPAPCTVLDPFAGTSTTAEVATRLGRRSIVCELNPEYFEAARIRDSQTGLALL